MRNETNGKYTPLVIVILFFGMIIVLGLTESAVIIFGGDLALIGIVFTVFTVEQKIRTMMKRKESKPLIQYESPITWLKACLLLSSISALTSLACILMSNLPTEINVPIIGNQSLLAYSIVFFIMGFIELIRLGVFMIDPSSKANIFAGKLIHKVLDISMRVIQLSFIVCIQVLNGLMLMQIIQIPLQQLFSTPITILYASTIVLSFIGTIPLTIAVVLHPYQHIKRRGWVAVAFFLSPWIVLAIATTLLRIGIKPL